MEYADAAFADSTKETYNTGIRHWLKFCIKIDFTPTDIDELTLADFAVYRARFDKVRSDTIRANIFHIRHHILISTFKTFSLSEFPFLKLILQGIDRTDPIPPGTLPLVADIVHDLIRINRVAGSRSWFEYVLEVMFIFAWAFCLRCSEYTKTKHWDAPLVSQLKFTKNKSGVPCLNYYLPRRKNKIHEIVEPIAIPCMCHEFPICGYCSMKKYLQRCNNRNITSPYLFVYKRKEKMQPMSAATFRRELAKLLQIKFADDFNPKIHRAHGFRYGGITSLGSIGIPKEYIRKISGHAVGSNVLDHYLKIKPEDNAGLILNHTTL